MGKRGEQSGAYTVERGRTRDVTVMREDCAQWGNMSLLSRADRMVCNSLEPVQTQPPKTMSSPKIALALSNHGMSKMKNSSFSRLDLPKRPPWSMLPTPCQVMLISLVSTTAPGWVEA